MLGFISQCTHYKNTPFQFHYLYLHIYGKGRLVWLDQQSIKLRRNFALIITQSCFVLFLNPLVLVFYNLYVWEYILLMKFNWLRIMDYVVQICVI